MTILLLVLSFISFGKENINSKELYNIKKQKNFSEVVLDIRTAKEWSKTGIIKNAVTKDYYDSSFKTYISKLDKKKKYYVYCHSGGRSASALKMMTDSGLDTVNITDGITGWIKAKYITTNYKE